MACLHLNPKNSVTVANGFYEYLMRYIILCFLPNVSALLRHANKIKTQQILGTVPLTSTMQLSEMSVTTCYRRLHAKSCELFAYKESDAYKIAKIQFSFQQRIK
jgi:hypothetical protein